MKLYLFSGQLSDDESQPFRVYLVAAPTEAKATEYLPQNLQLGQYGEADGTIDHPVGIVGWLGSRTAISIDGKI